MRMQGSRWTNFQNWQNVQSDLFIVQWNSHHDGGIFFLPFLRMKTCDLNFSFWCFSSFRKSSYALTMSIRIVFAVTERSVNRCCRCFYPWHPGDRIGDIFHGGLSNGHAGRGYRTGRQQGIVLDHRYLSVGRLSRWHTGRNLKIFQRGLPNRHGHPRGTNTFGSDARIG